MSLELEPQSSHSPITDSWFQAVIHGDEAAIRHLHDAGTSVETLHPIRQTTALVEACRRGLEHVAMLLLQLGAAPDFLCGHRQTTALHTAIRGQHLSIAHKLLPAITHFDRCDHQGNSYLHALTEHYQRPELQQQVMATAEYCIVAGTPLDIVNHDSVSALHYAVIHDWDAMAELLLMRGANVDLAAAESGATALMMAALDDNLPMARLLFAYHANPLLRMDNGKTAIDILPRLREEAPEDMQADIIRILGSASISKKRSTQSSKAV